MSQAHPLLRGRESRRTRVAPSYYLLLAVSIRRLKAATKGGGRSHSSFPRRGLCPFPPGTCFSFSLMAHPPFIMTSSRVIALLLPLLWQVHELPPLGVHHLHVRKFEILVCLGLRRLPSPSCSQHRCRSDDSGASPDVSFDAEVMISLSSTPPWVASRSPAYSFQA